MASMQLQTGPVTFSLPLKFLNSVARIGRTCTVGVGDPASDPPFPEGGLLWPSFAINLCHSTARISPSCPPLTATTLACELPRPRPKRGSNSRRKNALRQNSCPWAYLNLSAREAPEWGKLSGNKLFFPLLFYQHAPYSVICVCDPTCPSAPVFNNFPAQWLVQHALQFQWGHSDSVIYSMPSKSLPFSLKGVPLPPEPQLSTGTPHPYSRGSIVWTYEFMYCWAILFSRINSKYYSATKLLLTTSKAGVFLSHIWILGNLNTFKNFIFWRLVVHRVDKNWEWLSQAHLKRLLLLKMSANLSDITVSS